MEILVRHDLRLDEAALEIAMNSPRSLRRQTPTRDRPAADLFHAGREVVLQA